MSASRNGAGGRLSSFEELDRRPSLPVSFRPPDVAVRNSISSSGERVIHAILCIGKFVRVRLVEFFCFFFFGAFDENNGVVVPCDENKI